MFGLDSMEIVLCAVVALLVIGPKDLPKAMRVVGHWVGKARGVARHFRAGFDTMVREAELEELEKKWAAENERIRREFPFEAEAEADRAYAAEMRPLPAAGPPDLTKPGDTETPPAPPADEAKP